MCEYDPEVLVVGGILIFLGLSLLIWMFRD